MRRFGYPQSFATGVIAAGGTLGAMLPPSTVLAVYGIITEQDIGKLFIAGIIPGILAMTMYMLTIALIGWFRPGFLPTGPQTTWRERFAGLKNIWAPVLLFVFVIGGLYGLPFLPRFTPTEAGGGDTPLRYTSRLLCLTPRETSKKNGSARGRRPGPTG